MRPLYPLVDLPNAPVAFSMALRVTFGRDIHELAWKNFRTHFVSSTCLRPFANLNLERCDNMGKISNDLRQRAKHDMYDNLTRKHGKVLARYVRQEVAGKEFKMLNESIQQAFAHYVAQEVEKMFGDVFEEYRITGDKYASRIHGTCRVVNGRASQWISVILNNDPDYKRHEILVLDVDLQKKHGDMNIQRSQGRAG